MQRLEPTMSQPQKKTAPPPPPHALIRRSPNAPRLQAVASNPPPSATILPPADGVSEVLSLEALGGELEEAAVFAELPANEASGGPSSGVFSSPRRRYEDKIEDFGGTPLAAY